MKPIRIISLVFFIFFIMGANADAQRDRMMQQKKMQDYNCPFYASLDDQQQTSIDEIRQNRDLKMAELRADIRIKHAELQKMKLSETVSEDELFAKVDELGDLRKDLQKTRISAEREVLEILNPEQTKLYKTQKLRNRGPKNIGGKRMHKQGRKNHQIMRSCPYGNR